jgi:hypothetical protein
MRYVLDFVQACLLSVNYCAFFNSDKVTLDICKRSATSPVEPFENFKYESIHLVMFLAHSGVCSDAQIKLCSSIVVIKMQYQCPCQSTKPPIEHTTHKKDLNQDIHANFNHVASCSMPKKNCIHRRQPSKQ